MFRSDKPIKTDCRSQVARASLRVQQEGMEWVLNANKHQVYFGVKF